MILCAREPVRESLNSWQECAQFLASSYRVRRIVTLSNNDVIVCTRVQGVVRRYATFSSRPNLNFVS
ncbi:hypothetical protein PUN28_002868 [Cardiocondyla obscurior]|uniref:Uncharacterized protein n=1 Tax=Cardiocondyla obscurior TaxID=286306 RepID=A0AAW2GWD2_9HYME